MKKDNQGGGDTGKQHDFLFDLLPPIPADMVVKGDEITPVRVRMEHPEFRPHQGYMITPDAGKPAVFFPATAGLPDLKNGKYIPVSIETEDSLWIQGVGLGLDIRKGCTDVLTADDAAILHAIVHCTGLSRQPIPADGVYKDAARTFSLYELASIYYNKPREDLGRNNLELIIPKILKISNSHFIRMPKDKNGRRIRFRPIKENFSTTGEGDDQYANCLITLTVDGNILQYLREKDTASLISIPELLSIPGSDAKSIYTLLQLWARGRTQNNPFSISLKELMEKTRMALPSCKPNEMRREILRRFAGRKDQGDGIVGKLNGRLISTPSTGSKHHLKLDLNKSKKRGADDILLCWIEDAGEGERRDPLGTLAKKEGRLIEAWRRNGGDEQVFNQRVKAYKELPEDLVNRLEAIKIPAGTSFLTRNTFLIYVAILGIRTVENSVSLMERELKKPGNKIESPEGLMNYRLSKELEKAAAESKDTLI